MASAASGGRTSRQNRYSDGAIAFHWIIGGLIIVNLVLGIFHDPLGDAGWRVIPVHKAIGITVLVLSLGRIAWRLSHTPPPLPAMPGWQARIGHLNHLIFYVLMIALPLSGWYFVSAAEKKRPFEWFGLVDIPFLPVPVGTGGPFAAFHNLAGLAMAALVLLHVAAALYHHVVKRDRTLVRMAPVLER